MRLIAERGHIIIIIDNRLLAREGINAEQLARDLKSFELKTTFEDVFPSEATTVEEYLQQVHEMAMVSSIQEAQKDNLRSFNEYMMQVLEVRFCFGEILFFQVGIDFFVFLWTVAFVNFIVKLTHVLS
ncbi:nuclear pore complex protein NUP93A-like [Asparagus officinalis]|uniref:nuclear pore complex protein NUP93A-like n=1 Tax=Asparagus officinalis TaxID=4686 RepID=UPI00098E42E4|nr:nuclear pore complex protein NUP93A-like [Asparagus officinalis]